MKRTAAFFLVFVFLIALLPPKAQALDYGIDETGVPIYTGDLFTDYMAEEILKTIPTDGLSNVEKVRRVYDWIIKNCRREGAPDEPHFSEESIPEDYRTFHSGLDSIKKAGMADVPPSGDYSSRLAREMMLYRVGSCANYAALLQVLLGRLGFECPVVAGEFVNRDGSAVTHKWNIIYLNGSYYWLDIRIDHAGYVSTGRISYTYFLIKDTSKWRLSHKWDEAAYEESINYTQANAFSDAIKKGYTFTANPASAEVFVNGQPVVLDAFQINGNNYFQLRDLASALRGTENRFSVGWDEKLQAIFLTSGEEYNPEPEKVEKAEADETAAAAKPTGSPVYVDGIKRHPIAYNIGGSNYFRLRDVGENLGFEVSWQAENNAIQITTEKRSRDWQDWPGWDESSRWRRYRREQD